MVLFLITRISKRSMQVLRDDLYKPWFKGEEEWGVEIISGEFAGVIVKINSLNLSEKENGGVDIDLDIIKHSEETENIDTQTPLFNNTLEIIINDILKEAIEIYEQARVNDSEESDS